MSDASTPFRDVLHAWAAEQLEHRSDHNGPFRITGVRVESVHGYSVENDYIEVTISFDHDHCTFSNYDGTPCRGPRSWSMPDTTDTVTMLNELLALEK